MINGTAHQRGPSIMHIKDTRHATLDDYSITDVQVRCDWSEGSKHVVPYLNVSVKPQAYERARFDGSSRETKKTGAREVMIYFHELQKMMDALKDELDLCHQLLLEHDLIPKLVEARANKPPQRNSSDRT
jgi:hypothetical protein